MRTRLTLAAWAAAIVAVLLPASAAAQADDAASVTSDTAIYCYSLADRLQQAGEMPPIARALWEEGRAMCQQGHVRAGLARLRRAIMITHGGDNH